MVRKRIDHWIDGDSGVFSDGSKFRLASVGAPERHQFGGHRATRTAASMSGRSRGYVDVRVVARDKYGRNVVEMQNQDGSINQRMRLKGYRNKGR
jgi:micrococcal nuclease